MAGAIAAGPVGAWAADGGRQRPLISATSDHRPIGGPVGVCENVDVSTFRSLTATELRV